MEYTREYFVSIYCDEGNGRYLHPASGIYTRNPLLEGLDGWLDVSYIVEITVNPTTRQR